MAACDSVKKKMAGLRGPETLSKSQFHFVGDRPLGFQSMQFIGGALWG